MDIQPLSTDMKAKFKIWNSTVNSGSLASINLSPSWKNLEKRDFLMWNMMLRSCLRLKIIYAVDVQKNCPVCLFGRCLAAAVNDDGRRPNCSFWCLVRGQVTNIFHVSCRNMGHSSFLPKHTVWMSLAQFGNTKCTCEKNHLSCQNRNENSQNKKYVWKCLKQSSLITCTDLQLGKSFSIQKWQRGTRIH